MIHWSLILWYWDHKITQAPSNFSPRFHQFKAHLFGFQWKLLKLNIQNAHFVIVLIYQSSPHSTADFYQISPLLQHVIQVKKSQSQNSIQHFEFSRTFFSTGNRAMVGRRAKWQAYQCLKKCGKIQNVVSSSDFEIFSSEMYALVD